MAYDPFASVQKGIDFTQGIFDRSANLASGRALQTGDYNGAANAQFGNGNLAAGQGLLNQQTANQTAQREQRSAARTEQQAEQARTLGIYRQATTALRQRAQREGAQGALQEFDALAPALRLTGATDEQLLPLRQLIERDPTGALDMLESGIGQAELEFQKAGDRLLVFQGNDPNPVRTFDPQQQPIEVGGVLVDPVTFQPLVDTREAKTQTVQNSDGSSSVVAIDPSPVRGGGGSAAPSGSGFGTREEVLGFIAPIVGDFRPTSGARSREEQDSLIARGATSAYNSAHVGGLGQDIVPSAPREQWDQIANDLRATGRFGRVLVESGSGRNQGTGAHIHLEPRVGGGQASSPSQAGGVRVLAQGANNGPTPAGARAEANAARVENRQGRQDSRQLRRDFESQDGVQEYEAVRSAYNRLQSLTRSGSATDDTAVGFEFMKMLDPTSVVRESEYALVGQSQGIGGQALVALQRLSTGQRLTPELRRNLVETAGRVFQGRQSRYNELVQQYRGYAEEDGFDPNRVVPLRNDPATPARRLRFQASPEQLSASQQIVSARRGGAEPARGTTGNPILINPADPRGSYGNVRAGQYYLDPTGQLRQRR